MHSTFFFSATIASTAQLLILTFLNNTSESKNTKSLIINFSLQNVSSNIPYFMYNMTHLPVADLYTGKVLNKSIGMKHFNFINIKPCRIFTILRFDLFETFNFLKSKLF
jgi:hypothetical protein